MIAQFNNLIIFFFDHQLSVVSLLVSFLVTTFILDGLRFSKNIYIKILEYLLFFFIVYILVRGIYLLFIDPLQVIQYFIPEGLNGNIQATPLESTIPTQGSLNTTRSITQQPSITISREEAEILSDSLRAGVFQLSLTASIVGVGTAVATSLSKSGLPGPQKAALVIIGAVSGGVIHSLAS